MGKWNWAAAVVAILWLLTGATGCAVQQTEKPKEETTVTEKEETLPEDFILGMDASAVPALLQSGVKYYNFDGQEQNVFQTLQENGINYIRVRVWNDPYDEAGHGYGGGNCDIYNALKIGKQATEFGMKLLVDFHYSDFWADPGKQMAPKAWEGMSLTEKEKALFDYTCESLTLLKNSGVDVGMVQIGNEINNALAGETDWDGMLRLLEAGSKAVRQVYPSALIAVHFTNPERAGTYGWYAEKMQKYGLDYDVFASSYYPYWHGSMANLTAVLSQVHNTYYKKVMVVETSYAYTAVDTDFHRNTIGADDGMEKMYPFTPEGQTKFIREMVQTAAEIPGCIGVCYWEGTWISVGGSSWEENHQKWEQYGVGWASSYAGSYDSEDAGKYYGGCAVDNQALFDSEGRPLEALKVFFQLRFAQ